MPSRAAMTSSGTSRRWTLSDPSRLYVKAENMTPPTAKRIEEYESGAHPWVSAYFTTVKLKLQKSTVTSRRTSGETRWRTRADDIGAPRDRVESMAEPTIDDVDYLVGPATPHFAFQIRARVADLVSDLPENHPV